ncbi:hypothetical protein APHAL10511_008414 [Amanita phalloides]|nr:hypothetical protein APHAL10511_008414 [Amanita phalloides]
MAHAKSWHWDHYQKGDGKANGTHWKALCKYCVKHKYDRLKLVEQAALDASSISQARSKDIIMSEVQGNIKFTTGKLDVMNNHLLSCNYVPPQVWDHASKHKKSEGDETDEDEDRDVNHTVSRVSKRSHSLIESSGDPSQGRTDVRSIKKQKSFMVVATKHAPSTQKTQTLFEDQVLNAWILAGFSFNSIKDPEVQKLFLDFLPGATIPHCDQLSGTILKHAVAQKEHDLQARAKRQFATLQCDGWKDVSRKHLVAFMYTMA